MLFNKTSKTLIASILAVASVAGFIALGPTTQVNAQTVQPIQTFCAVPQHWDKVVFTVPVAINWKATSPNSPPQPTLVVGRTYDIKVIDDPATVADINQKIFDFLQTHGYILTNATGSPIITPVKFHIVQVDYAITCPGPIVTPPPSS